MSFEWVWNVCIPVWDCGGCFIIWSGIRECKNIGSGVLGRLLCGFALSAALACSLDPNNGCAKRLLLVRLRGAHAEEVGRQARTHIQSHDTRSYLSLVNCANLDAARWCAHSERKGRWNGAGAAQKKHQVKHAKVAHDTLAAAEKALTSLLSHLAIFFELLRCHLNQ